MLEHPYATFKGWYGGMGRRPMSSFFNGTMADATFCVAAAIVIDWRTVLSRTHDLLWPMPRVLRVSIDYSAYMTVQCRLGVNAMGVIR